MSFQNETALEFLASKSANSILWTLPWKKMPVFTRLESYRVDDVHHRSSKDLIGKYFDCRTLFSISAVLRPQLFKISTRYFTISYRQSISNGLPASPDPFAMTCAPVASLTFGLQVKSGWRSLQMSRWYASCFMYPSFVLQSQASFQVLASVKTGWMQRLSELKTTIHARNNGNSLQEDLNML